MSRGSVSWGECCCWGCRDDFREGKSAWVEYLMGEIVVEGAADGLCGSPSPMGDSCETCDMVSGLRNGSASPRWPGKAGALASG